MISILLKISTSLNYPTPYGTKPPCPQTYGLAPQSGAEKELIFPSGSVGEHKNGTILSTTEIIPAICGENQKPVKLRGVIFSL